jgi:hypothetical protein
VGFTGRNGTAAVELAIPPQVRVEEGAHSRRVVELILDGVELDAALERTRDVTELGSPVRSITSYRDPQVARRVILRIDLIAPCTSAVRRTGTGVRWQLDEEAAW